MRTGIWKKLRLRRVMHAAKQFLIYWKHFGFSMAWIQFWECLFSDSHGYSDYYIEKTSRLMQKKLKPIIKNYQKTETVQMKEPIHNLHGKKPVWICWWQGEKAMPDLVRICYRRICKAFDSEEFVVILITEENFQDYIEFPEIILERHQKGMIGYAHFSDILRWGLVASYGGIWFDACNYITYDSADHISKQLSYPFFTQRFQDKSECPNEPSRGLWVNGSFMGNRGSNIRIFQFVYDCLVFYWTKYDRAFHYVFLDYIIWAGYQTIPDIRQLIDDVPPNNQEFWGLWGMMDAPYREDVWNEMMSRCDWYKLTYKKNWKEYNSDGAITFWGKLLQTELQGTD